jgi:hypothetical protein
MEDPTASLRNLLLRLQDRDDDCYAIRLQNNLASID